MTTRFKLSSLGCLSLVDRLSELSNWPLSLICVSSMETRYVRLSVVAPDPCRAVLISNSEYLENVDDSMKNSSSKKMISINEVSDNLFRWETRL